MTSETALKSLVKRGERHAVDVPAIAFRPDGTSLSVTLRNMSYEGCLLLTDAAFAIGEKIRLAVPRMGEIRAEVRWASTVGMAGAHFVLEEIGAGEEHSRLAL